MKRLFVLVEAPDGYTWRQEIEWRIGETIAIAIKRYKRILGRGYWICDWYCIGGK